MDIKIPCLPCEAEKKYGGINRSHTCGRETQREEFMNPENKNEQVMRNFVEYCQKHPKERFWSALRNWSKYNYIYGSYNLINIKDKDWIEDTFYLETKK